jgi:phosphoribosylanthranilate isomerase
MFIKICGITSLADARLVTEVGANAIGLNFYSPSPRSIAIEAAREIVQSIPPYVDAVGLFVNQSPAEIREVAHAIGLRTLQLHGDISPELVAELGEFSVVSAFSLPPAGDLSGILEFVAGCERLGRMPCAILVDAYSSEKFGGTGQVAPWPLARSVVERCPVPVTLAGGLTPKNVAEAVRTVRPWGVDVASGVEVAPGRKEAYKVRKFVEEVRKASVPAGKR